MTRRNVDRIVRQLADLGVTAVNLGGNEPLFTHGLDPRDSLLPHVIRSLTEAGIATGLTTNGITVAELWERDRDALAALNDVDFSLDAPVASQHDALRGVPLFDGVLSGIARCREVGVPAGVVVCGMAPGFGPPLLEAFLALTGRLGCDLRMNLLKPVEKAMRMPSAADFWSGMGFLLSKAEITTQGEPCLTAMLGQGSQGCACGTSSFRICAPTPEGRVPVTPCVYLHDLAAGDLLTQDLGEILLDPLFRALARRRETFLDACRALGCTRWDRCRGGCAARARLARGSLDAPDPYCPMETLPLRESGPEWSEAPGNFTLAMGSGTRVHDGYLCTVIAVPPGSKAVPPALPRPTRWPHQR